MNPEELSFGTHPGLMESEENQDQPDDSQDQPQTETETQADLITLNRANLFSEFDRLQREDKAFANALNTLVGNKAKIKYQPRITDLEEQLQAYQRDMSRARITSMPDEEKQRRFATDPQFAQEYMDVVHNASSPDTERRQVLNVIENLFNRAEAMGLPENKVQEYRTAIQSGKYDLDEDGNPYTSWHMSFSALQQDLMQELWRQGQPNQVPSTPAVPTTPKVNPNLLQDGPDNTRNGRSQKVKYTATQIAQMNPEEMIRLFPNEGDYERAHEAGLIEGYDPHPIRGSI